VTDGTGPAAGIWSEVRPPGRMITWAALRIVASIAVVVTLYYLLPFDRSSTSVVVTMLIIWLVVFVGLVAFQIRAIIASPFPGLRAIEALATSVPLFLTLFAGTYFVTARLSPRQLHRPADPHRRAVLHRHGVLHRRVRRHHRQDRDRAARRHRADDPRPGLPPFTPAWVMPLRAGAMVGS